MEKIPVKSTSMQIHIPSKSLIARSLNQNMGYKFATSMDLANESNQTNEPLTYQPPTEFIKQRLREETERNNINQNASNSGRNRNGYSLGKNDKSNNNRKNSS